MKIYLYKQKIKSVPFNGKSIRGGGGTYRGSADRAGGRGKDSEEVGVTFLYLMLYNAPDAPVSPVLCVLMCSLPYVIQLLVCCYSATVLSVLPG